MEPTSRPPESAETAAFEGAPADRTTIDENGDAMRRTILVLADLETVWETIADPALRTEWDDGALDLNIDPNDAGARRLRGRRGDEETDIVLEVADVTAGTEVRLAEDGFRHAHPDARRRRRALDDATSYWHDALDRLAAVLEKQDSQ